jgi:hypothetical protein
MLADEEKRQILERAQYEREVRKQLEPEPKPASWVESKLGLLLIGFLLTGVIVPVLQYAQETIKWKRQNHFDNVKYNLTGMRDALKDFTSEWAYTAGTFQNAASYLERKDVSAADIAKFAAAETELETKVYQQHARVVASLEYFPDRAKVGIALEAFRVAAAAYYAALRKNVARSGQDDIEKRISELNEKYTSVVETMRQQIGKKQDENESFM